MFTYNQHTGKGVEDANTAEMSTGNTHIVATTSQIHRHGQQRTQAAVTIAVLGVVVGVAVLLTNCFPSIEYHQFGFKMHRSTGSVNVDMVYTAGRYPNSPDITFKTFPANAVTVRFNRATVFTSDRLEVSISCVFQYFLRFHQLSYLHEKYDLHYEKVMEDSALDAVKGAATVFSTDDFIWSRSEVEEALFRAIRERLGGNCCEIHCEMKDSCVPGCKNYTLCSPADMGLFAEVRYFQLGRLDIPRILVVRFTRALVLQEEAQMEHYKQQGKVVRINTKKLVEVIDNQGVEISQNATAQAEAIRTKARAQAAAIVEQGRIQGLQLLYDAVNITEQKHKASLDYIRALRSHKNARITVNYQQMIAGKL